MIDGVVVLEGKPVGYYGVTLARDESQPVLPKALPISSVHGNFNIGGIDAGYYDIVFSGPSFERYVVRHQRVIAGVRTSLGTVVVSSGRKLSGVIRDNAGKPVPGAWVRIQELDDPRDRRFEDDDPLTRLARRSFLAVTNDSGEYAIVGISQSANTDLYISATVDQVVSSGPLVLPSQVRTFDLVVQPVGGIEGIVPLPTSVASLVYAELRSLSVPYISFTVAVEKDGTFSMQNIPNRTYQLRVVGTDLPAQQVSIVPGKVSEVSWAP
jgi:hypothetical protein